MIEDEMVGWHHWLSGHEFEQVPGVGDGQGGLTCCSPWGHKESGMTEQLNWTEVGEGFRKWKFTEISHYRKTKWMSPLLWDCLGKALILGKIEGRRRRGQRDEMFRWHHWLSGHEFEQVRVDGEEQGSLVCCSPWVHKEKDMTEWLNKNNIVELIEFKCEMLVPGAKTKRERRVDNQKLQF